MKRVEIVAIAVGVLVIIGIVWAIFAGQIKKPSVGSVSVPTATSSAKAPTDPSLSATHAPLPANVTVPDKGAKDVPVNVAVPQTQVPAAPGVSANLRSFDLTETASAFTPDTVVVKSGDTVDIQITASGGNFDFTQPDYGLSLAVAQGATRKVEFQAGTTGKFTFYCSACGGPAKGPVGYVIVTNK